MRVPFDPAKITVRREWVTLPSSGQQVCVWQLHGPAAVDYMAFIAREREDPARQPNPVEHLFRQLAACCFDGDEPGARRVFSGASESALQRLTAPDLEALSGAFIRVNTTAAKEQA